MDSEQFKSWDFSTDNLDVFANGLLNGIAGNYR